MATQSLSKKNLCKYLKPLDGTLPLRGGRKEYAPDGSWLQAKRIESIHKERRAALVEEKCPKVGTVSVGEWLPDEFRIKVNKEMGKMWATMGYVENGVKYLDVEEALFLIDEGQMEVYYGGIPLSLQEAYAAFFVDGRLSLEQYQVYSHLLRLGYICRKFKQTNNPTIYERKIGLDKYVKTKTSKRRYEKVSGELNEEDTAYCDAEGLSKKAKFEERTTCSFPNAVIEDDSLEDTSMNKTQTGNDLKNSGTSKSDTKSSCSVKVEQSKATNSVDKLPSVEGIETPSKQPDVSYSFLVPYSKWDYETIMFPNIADTTEIELRAPPEHLLPCCIQLSKKEYKFDVRHMRNNKRIDNSDTQLQFSFGQAGWKASVTASNWGEYKSKVMERLSSSDYLQNCSPVSHLWKGGCDSVRPLVNPADSRSTAHLLASIDQVENADLCGQDKRLPETSCPAKIHYDVYKPDSKFKKTEEGNPNFRICVCRVEDNVPDLCVKSRLLTAYADDVPVFWAVVDNGSSTFYSFNLIELPKDLSSLAV